MPTFRDRLQHAWNAFNDQSKEDAKTSYNIVSTSYRPDRPRMTRGHERSIITAIYNRMAVDAASISIEHVRLDRDKRYLETIDSNFNTCLTLEANLDQTGRAFRQDVFMSMLDEGCIAIVPTDAELNRKTHNLIDITSLRTGKILEWFPDKVKVHLYNEKTNQYQDIFINKRSVAIVENPFYAVMNSPNSTLQRLIRKLNLLDAIDEQSGSGKLNMIIQLPYVIKSEARKTQAESRRKEIESQLVDSKYGIAYTDGTEKVTQLGRPLENNLMSQIEYLTSMLYSQLSMTTSVLDGTADEKTMLNYQNRTTEPLVSAVVDEMKRKFLSKTARSQRQSIMFFRDPFRLVPVSDIAEIADKFTRNEIMSSNEIRQAIGMKPVNDPKADELRNKNLNAAEGQEFATTDGSEVLEDPYKDEIPQEEMPQEEQQSTGSLEELMKTPMSMLMTE